MDALFSALISSLPLAFVDGPRNTDADDAGEEDDGNKTTQEEPGGGVCTCFVLRCCRLGGKVVEVLRNRC